jgi:hypothetical protein
MNKNGTRIDVPGFENGLKTGDFIDVPRIFGGRPSPKKSRTPLSLQELGFGQIVSRAGKGVLLATRIAKEDYLRRKRVRSRLEHKAIAADPIRPCNRRYFEQIGMKCSFLAYVEKPELFVSKAKQAYEITDGFLPFVTVTSSREALLIIASLAKFGIAAYFNKIAVP